MPEINEYAPTRSENETKIHRTGSWHYTDQQWKHGLQQWKYLYIFHIPDKAIAEFLQQYHNCHVSLHKSISDI